MARIQLLLRSLPFVAAGMLLSACGVESVGTAASVAKLQADQARQGKQTLDSVNASLEAASKTAEDKLKRAEGEGGSQP